MSDNPYLQGNFGPVTEETTAIKMFEARLSFDGCDIALSWCGRGTAGICEPAYTGRFAGVRWSASCGSQKLRWARPPSCWRTRRKR